MQAVEAYGLTPHLNVCDCRDALAVPQPPEVRQDQFLIRDDGPARKNGIAEVSVRARVHACGIIDVGHPHRRGDPLRRRRVHFLQHDDIGAAQRHVRLERVDRALDLARVLEVERHDAQRRQRRVRVEGDGL